MEQFGEESTLEGEVLEDNEEYVDVGDQAFEYDGDSEYVMDESAMRNRKFPRANVSSNALRVHDQATILKIRQLEKEERKAMEFHWLVICGRKV